MNNLLVVPIDGSPSSMKALAFAIDNAKMYQDKIILLNVQAKYEGLHNDRSIDQTEIKKLQELKGLEVMKEAINMLNGNNIPFEVKIRIGIATIEITSEAKEQEARMIILGSRGNGPVVSAVLGSVTYGVLHLATCPVTIVPLSSK
ncbi:universal stress protein [Anaerobacillus isosaccharinicus]|uniref:Universal stress protein n=1 Tax=Anaerobacillus isosaccharinicus TaxID=1532552 RepID=A0A1S2M1L4_9BACI|nr:universal stress protein [Anaerobacillus isosaccharinicus]MBA5587531.1 universal stress protein [Anaerobacillus isosaccharinicus]QOY34289.1 universal stress protein [Anaerobacillus isosaccharinicus]